MKDWDLRCGRYQEALKNVEMVDAVICDPPYSERTHNGHDGRKQRVKCDDRDLGYSFWKTQDVSEFVKFWAPRCRGWFCVMTSHDLAPAWEYAYREAELYAFTPLPCVIPGMSVRLAGDGPSTWSVWLMVARPRRLGFCDWGTLPGAYRAKANRGRNIHHIGGKPLGLMRQIIRDYTRPGDLVCDPCAGGATTLLAACMEGRRAIGAEVDPETYNKARARLEAGIPMNLFTGIEV